MNLRRLLIKKAALVVLTVFFIASLNFFIFQVLPGDPTRVLLPKGGSSNITATNALRATLLHDWGLDQPMTTRFMIYMGNLIRGNWGTSITAFPGTGVWEIILPRLATTLLLIGIATILTMWLGLILGRVSGWRRGKRVDVIVTMSSLFGYSMPSFWISLVLIYYLAVVFPVFPVHGQFTIGYEKLPVFNQFLDELYHFALPITAFVINNLAWFSLTMRGSLTDVLPEAYMVTAAAKGLTERQQLHWHALPNARLPVVTAAALYFGWVVSGAIVVEYVFDIQGLGQLTWQATVALDFPLLSAIFLVATLGVVIANAVTDVLYLYLDPRVRDV